MTDDLHIKIAAYIAGLLSSEEVEKFEEAMAKDPALQEEVALERQLYLHLNDETDKSFPADNEYVASLRTAMRSDEVKSLNKTLLRSRELYRKRQKKKKSKKLIVYLAAAIVAIVLIAGNGFFFKNTQSSYELYSAYYSNEDLPSFTKRGNHTSILQEAITSFNNSDYEAAIPLFNRYMSDNEQANAVNYIYLGLAYLELEDEEQAVAAFDKLINSNSIDRTKGLWFKALSYLKLGDELKARETLEDLIERKGFNYKEAEELLNEL